MLPDNRRTLLGLVGIFCCWCVIACKHNGAYDPPYEMAGGYVIGKEQCAGDSTQDYWLVDLSIFPLPNSYGDTLTFNGIAYSHVVKTKGLALQFKREGARVDLDFWLSKSRVGTLNCTLINPETYALKEMQVINQAEIR